MGHPVVLYELGRFLLICSHTLYRMAQKVNDYQIIKKIVLIRIKACHCD